MSKLVDLLDELDKRRTFGFFDDLEWFVTAHRYESTISDLGTIVQEDAAGGRIRLEPSDGTVGDNDETYLGTLEEMFLFASDKPIVIEARVQFTEANTDDANIIFGLADVVAANHLQDNGAGPLASYSGMVFFKVDGGTTWQAETSIAGTQTTTDLTAANSLDKVAKTAGGASFQVLRITFEPYSSTKANVAFWVDGVLAKTHDFTYTSATEMQLFAGVKNGGANHEKLVLDYWAAYQLR